jgi:cytochrome c oxidase assembly protein subunit 15
MTDTRTSPWLHRWSLLTVGAAVILLGLGSVVTNIKAGMADPVWPTKPTALLDSTPEQLHDTRWVVEHSHRLAGYVVGCCVIVLAAWLWLAERRRWLCWLGSAALLGVCVQGLLGGLRVTEHARWGLEFRILHGSMAPVVLSLLAMIAICTSRAWTRPMTTPDVGRLRRASLHAVGVVYLQVVLGVLLRHSYNPLAQRAHLLIAFGAVLSVAWLVRTAWASGDRVLRSGGLILACVVGLQVLLGVEAWMAQLSNAMLPELLPVTPRRISVRTAHVLGGAILLAATVCVAALARRDVAAATVAVPAPRLEEAA